MDAAKAAISKFTSRHGHTTDVEETVRPAITSEVVKPHRHEETVQAIDREVHQDHYHTTVQPIAHREVVPEVHLHNQMPVQHKEFEHGNRADTNQRVSAELGAFRDTSVVERTTHSQQAAPTVTGEHVHHHVHEVVQPVIHKETIKPEVVHTTIPVHETHHAPATHHGISALPMKTLDEFKQMGGSLTSSSTHTGEHYEGPPRQYNPELSTTFDKLGIGHGSHHTGTGVGAGAAGMGAAGAAGRRRSSSLSSVSSSDISEGGTRRRIRRHRNKDGTRSGITGNRTGGGLTGNSGSGLTGNNTGRTGGGLTGNSGSGLTGNNTGRTGTGYNDNTGVGHTGSGHTGSGHTGNTSTGNTGSRGGFGGLMDKLNPRTDTDGDGRTGIGK